MFIDALLKVDTAHAYTAAAVSQSSIDLGAGTGTIPAGTAGPIRAIGTGEPLGFLLSVDVAASSTTVLVEIIQTTGADLTGSIIVLETRSFLSADMPAGALHFMPIPQDIPIAGATRYIGLRVTPVGGAATVTLSASLTTHSLFSVLAKAYAKNYPT